MQRDVSPGANSHKVRAELSVNGAPSCRRWRSFAWLMLASRVVGCSGSPTTEPPLTRPPFASAVRSRAIIDAAEHACMPLVGVGAAAALLGVGVVANVAARRRKITTVEKQACESAYGALAEQYSGDPLPRRLPDDVRAHLSARRSELTDAYIDYQYGTYLKSARESTEPSSLRAARMSAALPLRAAGAAAGEAAPAPASKESNGSTYITPELREKVLRYSPRIRARAETSYRRRHLPTAPTRAGR